MQHSNYSVRPKSIYKIGKNSFLSGLILAFGVISNQLFYQCFTQLIFLYSILTFLSLYFCLKVNCLKIVNYFSLLPFTKYHTLLGFACLILLMILFYLLLTFFFHVTLLRWLKCLGWKLIVLLIRISGLKFRLLYR
jgi:hypothetical protein